MVMDRATDMDTDTWIVATMAITADMRTLAAAATSRARRADGIGMTIGGMIGAMTGISRTAIAAGN